MLWSDLNGVKRPSVAIGGTKRKKNPFFNNGYTPTNRELLKEIGDYDKVVTIFKQTDGLFDLHNNSAEAANDQLKDWGVSDLIVMGPNGGACVEATIRGALASGYKVWAYRDGIADFQYKTFVYPFSYSSRMFSFGDLNDVGLKELDNASQITYLNSETVPPAPESSSTH